MRVFDFDPVPQRHQWAREGWAHIKGAITADFLERARSFVRQCEAEDPLAGQGLNGAKDQWRYEPPPDTDLYGELFEAVSAVCGLRADDLTLSERHIKRYREDADPDPTAHKDRLASQVAVGLSIDVPAGSHLVLYPWNDVRVNPFLTTSLRDSLGPDELPEVVLRGARAVEIHDAPGDVIMFPGSAVWHLRRRSAGTINLYLKCNALGCDPLGEDPATEVVEQHTSALLAACDGESLRSCVPRLARRFEWAGRLSGRAWAEMPFAKVWGSSPLPVSETQLRVLEVVDGQLAWGELAEKVDGTAPAGRVDEEIRALAQRGLIDLV